MRFLGERLENRREFFRAAVRYTFLGLIAAAGALSARTNRLAGQPCVNLGVCSNCQQFARCELPAALSAKQVTRHAS
jgi:hypothetical protein